MANDLVVQLLLKTGGFSNDLKTAKGQIQGFKSEMGKAGTTLTSFSGDLGKVSKLLGKTGPWGAAAVAVAGMAKAFKDSGIYADQFAEAGAAANGALDSIKFNLANFSWDNFIADGITAAKVARDVARELDNLNTILGANAPVKNVSWDRYQTAITKAQDKGYSKEQRRAFLEQARSYKEEYLDSIKTELETGENKTIQTFKGYLGDVWGTFMKLSAEEQKKLMTQGASGQWGFNDMLKEAQDKAEKLRERHASDARQVSTWSARPEMQKTYQDMQAAEAYAKLLEKLVALENKANKKPEILKNFQELSELYLRGGNVSDLAGTVEELMDRTRASMEREISQVQARINNGDKTTTTTTPRGKSQAEKDKEELERALKAFKNYTDSMRKDLMQEKERELAIEKEKYDEQLAAAEKYGWDVAEITELYNQKVAAINKKYADKEIEEAKKTSDAKIKEIADLQKKALQEREKWQSLYDKALEASAKRNQTEKDVPWQSLAVASNSLGAISSYVSSIQSIGKAWEEAESEGEKFLIMIQGFETAINMLLTVADTVRSVQTIINDISVAKQIEEQSKLAVVEQARVAVEAEEAATLTLLSAEEVAQTAIVNALAGAYTELAAAETMAANVAAAGVAGVATGAAQIAAMTAAIVGAGTTVAAFANGGIVGGNSYSGDKMYARVNSGEMILNRAQQANLFKQINNGGATGGQVQFHISGTDLVGVLNNNYRKQSLVR